MSYLILVRHGKSDWNAKGLWTGWTDVSLNSEGQEDAKRTGDALKDLPIDIAYTSKLKRTKETWEIIKQQIGKSQTPIFETAALNERDYGIYTGKNKWQVKEEVGEETFQKIRRSWNHPIPQGETMEDVYKRVVPFYNQEILPKLQQEQNILLCASGNSLRALVRHLENLTEKQVEELEIGVGEAYVYKVDKTGKITDKEIRAQNSQRGKV